MKKKTMLVLALSGLIFAACGGAEEKEVEKVMYELDVKNSSLEWTGKYVADGHTHMGTVDLTSGVLNYEGEEFKSGEFTIDLASLKANDVEGEMKSNLEGHLMSADYFNTGVNKEVKVTVNDISSSEINATIELMGKKVEAKMPVKVEMKENSMMANGNFEIDFAALDLPGFKAAPGDPENAHPDTKISFKLNLKLNK